MPSVAVDWTASPRAEMATQPNAISILARLLRNGELILLLGAGVSRPLGLPTWSELVERCQELADASAKDAGPIERPADLMRAIDVVRRRLGSESALRDIVRKALYQGIDTTDGRYEPDSVTASPMLRALGALVMSSARGSAGEVLTLNFDDLLEWYLHLHGFSSQVVEDLPALLSDDVDVHVFHMHGFLPLNEGVFPESPSIVLSQTQLEERLAQSAEFPWGAFLLSRLYSKVFLAIGTSMSDTDVGVTLRLARRHMTEKRPHGFVLGYHTKDDAEALAERDLVPVHFDDLELIPKFLLAICQRAAAF